MADDTGTEAETGESGGIPEPLPRPPPTIDDIEIPPPPPPEDVVPPTPPPPPPEEQASPPALSGEQAPPPTLQEEQAPPLPLSEETSAPLPPEEDTPLPPPTNEDTPSDVPPQTDPTPASTCNGHAEDVPEAPEDQQVTDHQETSEVNEVGVDHPPTSDCGSPLPPYNDSGVDVPSMSAADASVLEGKELQSEIDEIQIEVPDDTSNGIHNASTLPSKRSMGTTTPTANQHSKLTGYIEMSPEETKVEMTRVSTYRRESVMWVIIFLLLAGVIAVIFYFTFNIVNLSDASLPDGQFRVRAVIILDHPWEENLAISTTTESMELANNITYGINSTFKDQSSTFKDIFLGVDMISFSNEDGDIRASFQCVFGGSPSEDISTRPAFADLFIAELEDGFDNDNFFDLELTEDESVNVFRFVPL